MRQVPLAGIALLLALPALADESPARAAAGAPLPTGGGRVKLELAGDGRTIVGTLRRIEAGSLILDVRGAAEPVAVERRAVARLSLRTGSRKQIAKGAVLGAVIGFAATWVVAQLAPGSCPSCSDDSYWKATAVASVLVGAPLGAAIGAAAAPRTDVWTPTELPSPSPGPAVELACPSAGARQGAAITIRF